MLEVKITQSGRIKIDDINRKLMKLDHKLKISEINNLLKKYSDDLIDDIKNFFINREYEKLGKMYPPLSDEWSKKKVAQYINHFHINTMDMLNSLYKKVSGGRIIVNVSEDQREKFEAIENLRSIAEDHQEYFSQKMLENIEKELSRWTEE